MERNAFTHKRYIGTIFDYNIWQKRFNQEIGLMKKQKAIRCDMTYDRLQALTRNPGFLKDYKELFEHGPKKDFLERRGEFIKKHGLSVTFDPEDFKGYPGEFTPYASELLQDVSFFRDEIVIWSSPVNDVHAAMEVDDMGFFIKWKKDPFLKDNRYWNLTVDLSHGKKAVMAQFECLLDAHLKFVQKKGTRNTQSRKIDKYKVWDEYLKTKSFSKIAKMYKVKESTVRMAYLKAFERIMGEKYNPEKHDRKQIKKEQLAKTCDKCESRSFCTTICPEVLGYVNQDYASQREWFIFREPYQREPY